MQLKINRPHDTIFEWIPYNEFIIINELEKYILAIWGKESDSCKKVYLRNLLEITDEVLNEVLKISIYFIYI
jgi:hypothetical protein